MSDPIEFHEPDPAPPAPEPEQKSAPVKRARAEKYQPFKWTAKKK